MSEELWRRVIVVAIMLLVGFPVHEFSHALAAYRLGDSTAKLFGPADPQPDRPFRPARRHPAGDHVHRLAGRRSASAGPSRRRSTRRNLEGGRRGEAIVAAAGPISNLVLAIAARAARCATSSRRRRWSTRSRSLAAGAVHRSSSSTSMLMVFNLFPIPPLDGSKVLFAFLPPQVAWRWRPVLEQYGFILLLLVFFVLPAAAIRSGPHRRRSSMLSRLPGGRLRSASSARTSGPGWAPTSARTGGLAHPGPARPVRLDARRRSAPRPRRRGDAARRGRDRPRGPRSPGCSTTPARARPGSGRGSRTRSVRHTARGSGGSPPSCPAGARRSAGCRTTPRHPPCSRRAAGCSPRTVELIRHQDAPIDPSRGRAAPARGRGELMTDPACRTVAPAPCPRSRRAAGGPLRRVGRRPETATHVQLAAFDGPLGLLLSLIEARQLDVLTVPLGGLADAYLEALATLEADRLGQHQRIRRGRFASSSSSRAGRCCRGRPPPPSRPPTRRRPRSRGGAAGAAPALPRPSRRGPPAGGRRARADRPVPARGRCGARPRRSPGPDRADVPADRPVARWSTRSRTSL